MPETIYDLIIIGAGAAGLTAGIFAGRKAQEEGRPPSILVLDGARKPGAKILVSGGGRCNVTNETVTPDDYCGGSKKIIRNVLRRFDEHKTVEWMEEMGVHLKREPRGKLFPTTDKARTVLDGLFAELRKVGGELRPEHRVRDLTKRDGGNFTVHLQDRDPLIARKVVLASGGRALPKSGSDGWGIELMRKFGHAIIETTPSLVPLMLDTDHTTGKLLTELSGTASDLELEVTEPSGKHLFRRKESLLLTHFGLSGPAALDVSRYFLRAKVDQHIAPRMLLRLPQFPTPQSSDQWLQKQIAQSGKKSVGNALGALLPDRLAKAIAGDSTTFALLTKPQRLELAKRLGGWELPVIDSRGYTFAETTSGGVALEEINYRTMESRRLPGLYLCGEILDVDGRLGGFNFQWAWASGFIAGQSASPETPSS